MTRPGTLLLAPVLCMMLTVPTMAAQALTAQEQNRFAYEPVAQGIDPAIRRALAGTLAIDNHAHPVLSPPALATDRNFDALPVDNMAPQTDPVALRDNFAQLRFAWKALWDFDGVPPLTPAQQTQLEAARDRVRAKEGTHYSQWAIEQAGIETMLANRVAMGTGVAPPHFQWVPYDDALLFPLNNAGMRNTPDREVFFPLEEGLRSTYFSAVGLSAAPATLDEYLSRVVVPTLERQKKGGALAIKFEVAYLRDFGFADVPRSEAAATYAQYASRAGVPPAAAYKALQDFLFRYIAMEAGRLGMAVHLHSMAGSGSYFSTAGANPLLLEPVLNDSRLRNTRFVLLHGGWPFTREAGALLLKPNLYLDISQEDSLLPAATLAPILREYLETFPEKILFATDAYPYAPFNGWEETAWYAAGNARTALGLALTGMLRDGEIDAPRAAELARMVLRSNAAHLYGLPE